MKVRRSRLEVLGILDYVDLHGADAASERYGVDGRTLKRWAEREPSGWQREEEVNRLLMIEKRIAGKVNYRDAVVGLGVATDKLWRLADRAARALRREGEADSETPRDRRRQAWLRFRYPNSGPERVAVVEEDEERLHRYLDCASRLIAEELRAELSKRQTEQLDPTKGEVPEPYVAEDEGLGDPALLGVGVYAEWRKMADDSEQDMSHVKAWLAAEPPADAAEFAGLSTDDMTDAEYSGFLGRLRVLCIAKAQEWWPSYLDAQEAVRVERETPRPVAAVADEPSEPVDEPTPLATARAARPEPVPMVLDVGDGRDTWHPYYREDF